MDLTTIGVAVVVAKKIPGSATQEATEAADRAEAAASSVEGYAETIQQILDNTIFIDESGNFYVN